MRLSFEIVDKFVRDKSGTLCCQLNFAAESGMIWQVSCYQALSIRLLLPGMYGIPDTVFGNRSPVSCTQYISSVEHQFSHLRLNYATYQRTYATCLLDYAILVRKERSYAAYHAATVAESKIPKRVILVAYLSIYRRFSQLGNKVQWQQFIRISQLLIIHRTNSGTFLRLRECRWDTEKQSNRTLGKDWSFIYLLRSFWAVWLEKDKIIN